MSINDREAWYPLDPKIANRVARQMAERINELAVDNLKGNPTDYRWYAQHDDGTIIWLDGGSYTPDRPGRWTIKHAPLCRHQYQPRGPADDQWLECFLCGDQRDAP